MIFLSIAKFLLICAAIYMIGKRAEAALTWLVDKIVGYFLPLPPKD